VTTSPAANASEPRPEEFPMEPIKAEAPPSEPQVQEYPVEPGQAEAPTPDPKPLLKANMVAREVWVTATGAPPDKNAVEREVFTEETSSVLVCETGGVIQLSAAVAPGQLLLLANVESKREVVAQVKRKRAYRPTICYVELEFAEPAPRFWGTEFSAASALLPKAAQDAETAALVVAAEATADEPGEPPVAPSVEEVQAFKREVEALRGQSKLMAAPTTSQEAPAPLPVAVSEASPALAAGDAPGTPSDSNSGLHETPGSAFTETSPPIEHHRGVMELAAAVEQAQLPKPAMDFSMSLPKRKRSLRARGSFTPNFRGGVLRLALLTAMLLVTVVGAAWYKHWIPWKSATRNSPDSLSAIAANAKRSPLPGSPEAAEHSEFNNTKVASDTPVTSEGVPSRGAALPDSVPPEPKDAVEHGAQPVASRGSVAQPAVRRTSPSISPTANRSTVRPTAAAASESVAASAAESVFVPPKLIKSVRAEVSIDALRDFERGNVVIDAVVGSAGEVNFISVLSGPPSLRAAAVESLKHYQYEPATRNGQPVPAHVTITIHFRFEP
jgi:TonB family protein